MKNIIVCKYAIKVYNKMLVCVTVYCACKMHPFMAHHAGGQHAKMEDTKKPYFYNLAPDFYTKTLYITKTLYTTKNRSQKINLRATM